MRPSRGMGAINKSKIPGAMPDKMPAGKVKKRRDNTDFTQYKEGGTVNKAGNYTKPSLRKRIVAQVKAAATHGTGAGHPASSSVTRCHPDRCGHHRLLVSGHERGNIPTVHS